ncbi:LysR family transcriptional regulator [Deinococcus metallilatus]|uniref:DNA-binding transcriptional LysR family regulator n=1 Tax=Deinococcus metallilatus TaxID=1211322 RepID=A0AAJ5F0G0_9DEIO|nr:LysR substrate-binding domain-containing protein [Deinococcus metallilatus]MBB5297245.1 DNA-binding transcriptional LysR family regulator [Deinococcus metallilatus]QBY09663.1 LysR family transcriptional regulator [Deinococcus metallilatus]RXJ09035.1 LysR family transcriptional regulator [Deinococcus metallilatus]TLK21290.1 LysR family transcriptional regulator [Deinococcus metallilatus]GMA17188.1 LysR family transcriptional regulator [Deinococcus metallilatus]
MELRHLRHFVALAEEEHFGRAAERVFVVQQALSNSIKNLEDEVGVPLVLRTTRRVQLTPAGREFLVGARETLAQAAQTVERARRAARGEVGRLTVGFVSGLAFGGLPEIVRAFRELYPNVSVDLRELTAQEQEAGLRGGQIDVGLMLLPVRDPGLDSQPLWRQPLVAALPAGHPLARRRRLRIADLRDERFVFFPRHLRATYFDQVMRWCSGAGFTPNVVQEAIEIPTLLSLVAAGVGVFLPIQFFERLSLPGVVYRPLEDAPLIDIVAVWRREEEEEGGPIVRAFLKVAQEALGAQAGG